MIRLFITVDDITNVLAAGYTVIRVYTDSAEGGTFTILDGTETLVAGTESYEYIDTDGTTSTWYKTCYYGAVPGESSKSAARKGGTASAYATVRELRNRIGKTLTGMDVELAALLDAAAKSIDRKCQEPDGFFADVTASARIFPGSGMPFQFIDHCASISSVAVKDAADDSTYTSWAATDWIAFRGHPDRPDFQPTVWGRPYNGIMVAADGDYSTFTSGSYTTRAGFRPMTNVSRNVPTVQVTACWGYSATVPDDIREANVIQAARWFKRGQSAWADATGNPELGQLYYRKPLDPDIVNILVEGRYMREMPA